jgi:hypothetical protein
VGRALVAAVAAALGLAGSAAAAGELAFVQDGRVALWDPATGTTIPVTQGEGPFRASGGDLARSPDGTRIAYTATLPRGTTVRVVSLDGSENREVTPWRTPYLGGRFHADPRWLSADRLSYLDPTGGSGRLSFLRTVELASGDRGRLMPDLVASQSFALAAGARAYARVVPYPGGPGCADTTDIALRTGTRERWLTRTRNAWEAPLDAQANAGVLVVAQRVAEGKHRGGCLLGPGTVSRELRAVQAGGASAQLVLLATVAEPGRVDAAWSPEATLLAYTDGAGRLVVRTLATGEEIVLAETGVTALDW